MKDHPISVDDLIVTDRLNERPRRSPDYAAENRALGALARELAERPENLLPKLAETLVELGIADSAGISIEELAETHQFRWVALAGVWSHHKGGTIPFDASPCGIVVERDEMMLFESPERFFPAARAEPLIHEGLLVPFHSDGRPVGTLWINSHRPDRKFDWEDARLIQDLSRFAAAGYQMTIALRSAEAGRMASDTRLRALAHASSDVFYIMSADMRVLRELSGANFIPDATSPGRDWLREYVPPEDRARILVAIGEAIQTKGVFELEHQVRQVNGELGWAMSRAVPIFDAEGEIVEWFGAASDITERKQAEIAQRENEARQAFLLKLSDALRPLAEPVAIQEVAARVVGAHLGASRVAYVEFTGDEYVIKRDYTDGISSMVGRHPVASFGAGKLTDYNNGRTRVICDTGSDIHNTPSDDANFASFQVRAGIGVPLIKGGKFVAALVVHMNAPRDWAPGEVAIVEETAERTWQAVERARAEAALRESEARLAAAFATVPVGIAVIDIDGRVRTANDDYLRLLPRGAIPSRDPAALSRWRAWDAEGRMLEPSDFPGARALRGERVVPGQEMLHIADDGRQVWTRVASVPIFDESGQVAALASVVSDIDDAKRTADALRASEARYRSLFQSIDDGYALIEFLPRVDGQQPDFRFVEVNASFERQTGNHDVTGKLGSEINPGDDAVWIETFGDVARSSLPRRFEIHHRQTGRWYNAFATPVGDAGSRQVCVVFADTTERKEREERQAFQLTLSDTLRPLADTGEITEAATRLLGEQLGANRVYYVRWPAGADYGEVGRDYATPGTASLAARYPIDTFRSAYDRLCEGRTWIVQDNATADISEHEREHYASVGVLAWVDVPLLKRGRVEAALCVVQDRPRKWTAAEIALIDETAERVWAAVERARVEAALAESEKKHRTLFETMGQGYGEVEIVRDADGRAVDHRYIELNPAFERLVGVPAAQAKGRLAGEVIPGLEPWWHETFDRIARGGEPKQIEFAVGPLNTWFSVFAYPQGGDRLILLYEDITERKWAETALRESEERQAFLLKLSDMLRPLTDANVMKENASRLLGEHLGVDRAGYVDLYPDVEQADIQHEGWLAPGVPSAAGVYRTASFHGFADQLLHGETAVMENSLDDPRVPPGSWEGSWGLLDVRAAVSHALMKNGRLAASFYVHSIAPRRWSEAEISLIVEVGERTWEAMERARAEAALRVSEERLLQFGEASHDVLWIRDAATLQWTYLTPAFETIYGVQREAALSGDDYRNWQDLIVPEDRAQAVAAIERVLAGEWVTFEYRVQRPSDGAIRWIRNTDFPISDKTGTIVTIGGVGHDMTDIKVAQAKIAESEVRLRTLMEGIPQLVWRSCDKGMWTWSSPQWQDFTGQTQGESHGLGWLDAVHPDDHAATMLAWEFAKPHGMLDAEYRVRRAADGAWLWHHTRSVPVRDARGMIVEWLGTTTDIHALRELQERQGVLVAELQHRTRNLITVVRSLSDRTVGNAASLDDFKGRFGRRLAALSRVQGLLSHLSAGERVDFGELLRSELTALGVAFGMADRVTLDGPADVPLRSATVQTLALAIHELSTNAVKYGALSATAPPSAHLTVRWHVERPNTDDPPVLHVDWREDGVVTPQVGAPARGGGYGRELIERALPYQLGAKTTYEVGADGVRCTIEMPISREGGNAE